MNQLPQFELGYIRGGQVAGVFMESLATALIYDAQVWNVWRGRIVPVKCAHYLNVGRNQVVAQFCDRYAAECPVFVFADTDHKWTPPQLMRLVACCTPETPIVSALYWACDEEGQQVRPVLLRRQADESLVTDWEYPADAMFERDVVGMGLCAIRTDLLLGMGDQTGDRWFDFDHTRDGTFMPEDNAFCRRAQERGAKIYVHTGIRIGHLKEALFESEDQKRNHFPRRAKP